MHNNDIILKDIDYHERLEEYCKLHPYFERTVRHFVNMFRYIPYSEVLDTFDYLLHDRFMNIMLEELGQGIQYVFLAFKKGKSGHYFTHLFVDMIKKKLDPKLHHMIIIDEHYTDLTIHNHTNLNIIPEYDKLYICRYIIVDDGSYSGLQMLDNMSLVPGGQLYIVLVAASESAIDVIEQKVVARDYAPNPIIKTTLKDKFIGAIYPNSFKISPEELYFEWDIIYESNGVIYPLIGAMAYQGTSIFYFQHKIADVASIPDVLLIGLRNPTKVDKILTREEKRELMPEPTKDYAEELDIFYLDYDYTDDPEKSKDYFRLIERPKPFYKENITSGI